MQADNTNTLRLKVVAAELDAGAVIAVLQLFKERDVSPRKITAQRLLLRHRNQEVLHVEIELDAADITIDALRFIAASIAQRPMTLSTVFSQDPEQTGHGGTHTPSSSPSMRAVIQ